MKPTFGSALVPVSSTVELEALLSFLSWLGPLSVQEAHFVLLGKSTVPIYRAFEKRMLSLQKRCPGIALSYEMHGVAGGLFSLLEQKGSNLLMVSSDGLFDPSLSLIIEGAEVPVLIVPRTFRRRRRRGCILVPMSGEVRENRALEISMRLGCTLGTPVDIVHVASSPEASAACIDQYADDAYHELPKMIDEFIAEASPLTSLEDKKCLRNFYISRGQAKEEILSRISANKSDLIAVQWKGSFVNGHAKLLKSILKETDSAVLLVKRKEEAPFKLKAGTNLGAA